MTEKIIPCPWCNNHKGEDELQFTIIDDDCGQYVTEKLIRFCPFCGKELKEREGE
jgi:sarcosine oxidase delta subunit